MRWCGGGDDGGVQTGRIRKGLTRRTCWMKLYGSRVVLIGEARVEAKAEAQGEWLTAQFRELSYRSAKST